MFFFFRFFFLRFGRSVGFEPFDWAINMTSRAHCNQPTWTKSEDIRSNYFDLTSEYMSTPFGYRNSQKQNQTKSFWNPKSLYIRYLSKLWIVQSKLWNEYKYWYVRTHQPLSFHIHISTSEDRQWSSYTHKIAKLALSQHSTNVYCSYVEIVQNRCHLLNSKTYSFKVHSRHLFKTWHKNKNLFYSQSH